MGGQIFLLVVHQPASLASCASTPAGSVHKSRGDNVGAVEEMICECYRGGIVVVDVIWRRLYKYELRKGDFCSELGKGATSEAGKYLFRADNVWWRCAQYFIIDSCG